MMKMPIPNSATVNRREAKGRSTVVINEDADVPRTASTRSVAGAEIELVDIRQFLNMLRRVPRDAVFGTRQIHATA
jgi:hypothetical protein